MATTESLEQARRLLRRVIVPPAPTHSHIQAGAQDYDNPSTGHRCQSPRSVVKDEPEHRRFEAMIVEVMAKLLDIEKRLGELSSIENHD